MRDEPLPPPTIRVMSNAEFQEILKEQPHLKGSIAIHGRVSELEDTICFLNMRNSTEYACLKVLLHEVDHWAQEMYLDDGENMMRTAQYSKVASVGEIPFVEYAVAFSGGYDYETWEKKYGRKNTPDKIDINRYYGYTDI